uniref:Uncharacterized protein n=1 Tax=Meloidogyne javanica TaxID=6303 RepID=A0A915LZI5_MELJA
MDKAIIKEIYKQHLENKKKLGKEYKNVIVESDGPVGLYAGFELFMEGMNVTLVNNRSEDYTRNRVVFFDRRWMPQLRFFLGTEFDKLSFAVLDINSNHEKPLAILGAPVNRPQSFDYGHIKQILTNYEGMTIWELNKTIAIPFDLIFCDFIKQIKYGAAILNKTHNRKIFKENQEMSFKINSMDKSLIINYTQLAKESFLLTQKIRNRYYYMNLLICYNMEEVKDTSQIPLTRTGKVYKTIFNGRIDNSKDDENISVQIFETDTKIQIESETPMAIVELIEEVKNEREELEEMNEEEFKERWYEVNINREKYKHDKAHEKLVRIKDRNLRERGYGYENLQKELDKMLNKRNKLLKEKIENIKIKNDKLFEKGLLNIEEEHEKILEKYDDFIVGLKENWFKALFYHVLKYKSEGKKKVIIQLSKEKGEASSSNVEANEEEQDKHVLYFDKNSSIRKTVVEKIYGKEANVKLVKEKRDSGILVSINDENTTDKINEGLVEVEKAVSAIKIYNKSGEQMDLTEMLMEALKTPELN